MSQRSSVRLWPGISPIIFIVHYIRGVVLRVQTPTSGNTPQCTGTFDDNIDRRGSFKIPTSQTVVHL